MCDLHEATGVNFEIVLEKFQQDLEDITRNRKEEDVLSNMEKNELIKEVISLNGQVNSLADTFSCVNLEKGKIDEAFASLRKNVAAKGDDSGRFDNLDLATQRIEELQAELKRMKADHKEGDKGTSVSQFSSMETALKRSQERESELQREVVNAEKKLSNLEYQLKTTKEKLDTAELSIKDSEKQVLSLKEELLVFTKKETTLAGSNKQNENLQKEIRDLKLRINSCQQETSDKDGDIKRLRASIADKQAIMEGYVAEITRMKGIAKTERSSNKDHESMKLKFDDVCKERDSLQREVARLAAKKQTEVSIQLESQTVGYRKQLRDKDDTIDRLRTKSMSLKSENESLKDRAVSTASQVEGREYDILQRRYDGLWGEKETLRKELDEMKTRTRKSSVNIESYRQEIREKEIAVDRLRSENITLQAQLESLKKDAADISTSSDYTMRVHSTSVQLDSNEEFYRQEIKDRDAVIDRLRADTMTLHAEIDGLKRDMRSYYSRTEFDALKLKYDELLKERDTLREQVMEVRSTSERDMSIHIESRMGGFQQDVRDREALIDKLRSENLIIMNELETLKREVSGRSSVTDGYLGEIERLRQEILSLKTSSTDYETLKRTYEEVCKERDFVRNQLMEVKTQSETEITTHLESYYQAYRHDVREKEIAIDRMRSENTTLRAELEGIRREMSSFYKRTEYESLKLQFDEMWKERDALREELIVLKAKGERDMLILVENKTVIFQKEIREKEMECAKLRSEMMSIQMNFDGFKRDFESKQHLIEGYQSEIERLKGDFTTLKSTTVTTTEYESLRRMYEDVLKERDGMRMELFEVRSNSERELTVQVENQVRIYREEIREKEVIINNFRSDSMKFQAETEMLRREIDSKQYMVEGYLTEIDRLKSEINGYSKRIVEFDTIKRSYEEVCRERDYIQRQFTDFKTRSEQDVTLQIQIQTDGFRQEIKEKDMAIERFSSQSKLLIEELDGLKRERSSFYSKSEYDSLRQQYEEMWKERDALRGQIADFKSKGERELIVQIESRTETFRTEIREKENIIGRLQSESLKYQTEIDGLRRQLGNQEAYLVEIERLKKEVSVLRFPDIRGSSEFISLQRTYEEVCKERDGLRGQVVEIKMKGEQNLENQVLIYREEIREKEMTINGLRSESMTFKAEIDGLKRDLGSQDSYLLEIERLKKEVSTLRFPDIRGSSEFISLQRTYEEVCKERDGLRGQVIDIKMKGDQNLENQVQIYREEIREKEMTINGLRSETITFKAEIDGLKRDLGSQDSYLLEIERLKKEVSTLRFPDIRGSSEFISLQRTYEEVCKERDALRGQVIDIKMKGEQNLENQVQIYREGIREREIAMNGVRTETMTFKAEIEGLKRQLGNQEAYLIEIERLKKEVTTLRFPDIRGSSEFISLQRTYEEVCKERDALRGQVIDIKMKGDQNLENQVHIYREEIREKEMTINGLRSETMTFKAEIEGFKRDLGNQEAYLIEIERLTKEVNTLRFPDIRGSSEFISLQRTYEEICKERDALRGQVIDIKMKGEQNLENQVQIYREEIREREIAMNGVRTETMTFKAEIEGLKRQLGNQEAYLIEIERLKKEVTTLRFPDIRGSSEFISLQRTYEEVCKERDALRGQVIDIKMKGDQNLENQVHIYREEIREKEMTINGLRSETMTFKAEIEGFKRDLGNQEAYLIEIERLTKEVNTLRFPDIRGSSEFISLQRTYEEVCKERDALRGQVIDIKMKGEQNLENQVHIYREEIREKEMAMEKVRVESMGFRAEIDGFKRQLGNQEAYLIEIERLKKEVGTLRFPDIRGSSEFISLQRTYEEVCKERDALRGQVIDIKMKGDQNLENQVHIYREEIREKEMAMEKVRVESMGFRAEIDGFKRQLGNQEAYLIEIERLKKEVGTLRFPDIRGSSEFISLQRTYEEVCKERDGLRGQVVEIKMKGEQNFESQVKMYREEIREKEMALDKLRSENMTFRAEIDGLKRELTTTKQRSLVEVERVRKESTIINPSVIRSSAEFVTLQRSYETICQERDNLRQQMMDSRTKNEREVSIQIDNQVRVYRDELKEKDRALEMLRSESITLRTEVETLRRDLRIAKETPVHDTKMEQELFNLRTKFAKLQEEYNIVMLAKSKLEEEMVIKVNSGMVDKQEYIYKIEKENRELKSENEYYEKTVDEKNTAIGDLRLNITHLQKKVENLKKEIFVAEEAYEKAELRLKEVLKSDYKPVTTYEVRRYRLSTADSPTYTSSTSTYTAKKASPSGDADALHFSATSTPIKSGLDGERSETIRKSTIVTSASAPLDSDLARAEGNFQSSDGITTTTKTTLVTDNSDAVSDAGSVGSASGYRQSSGSYRTGSSSTYRTTSGYTTGRTSVSGRTSYPATGRKYSGRYSVTRKFY
ncbi:hypothetical protein OS493_024197 [Desmophyllum pertusum]|uniref:Uncharacterized protein n=1 Tax=Desmophyllum pertusum TaxID=174260 RepID=A0A9W9ZCR6_9CNID|nr:hypothetical protein OS493_024197 [Desmophyllum pertusum]